MVVRSWSGEMMKVKVNKCQQSCHLFELFFNVFAV